MSVMASRILFTIFEAYRLQHSRRAERLCRAAEPVRVSLIQPLRLHVPHKRYAAPHELRQRVKRIRRTRSDKQMLPADAAELGGKPVRVDGLAVDVDVDEILTIFGHNSVRNLDGGYLDKIVFAHHRAVKPNDDDVFWKILAGSGGGLLVVRCSDAANRSA